VCAWFFFFFFSAFLRTDEESKKLNIETSGATAVVSLIQTINEETGDRNLLVANVGDSRAVLVEKTVTVSSNTAAADTAAATTTGGNDATAIASDVSSSSSSTAMDVHEEDLQYASVARSSTGTIITTTTAQPTNNQQQMDEAMNEEDLDTPPPTTTSSAPKTTPSYTAIRLTIDHRADDIDEQRRIREVGGFVVRNRVLGILAVSRSFGDHGMKDFVIGKKRFYILLLYNIKDDYYDDYYYYYDYIDLAEPYIQSAILKRDIHPMLILACDGVWDVFSDQKAVDLLMEHYEANEQQPFEYAARYLVI
jgi:serine/threonine protein phosphatase PrpC